MKWPLYTWLLISNIVNEIEVVAMTLVAYMVLADNFGPAFGIVREEAVGGGWSVCHLGQTKAVGKGYCLLIDVSAANDEDFLTGRAVGKSLVERLVAVAPRQLAHGGGEHDVAAVWQCAFRERLESASPHDDGVTCGQCLETFQVVGQPIDEFVVVAYGSVARHGGYN